MYVLVRYNRERVKHIVQDQVIRHVQLNDVEDFKQNELYDVWWDGNDDTYDDYYLAHIPPQSKTPWSEIEKDSTSLRYNYSPDSKTELLAPTISEVVACDQVSHLDVVAPHNISSGKGMGSGGPGRVDSRATSQSRSLATAAHNTYHMAEVG
ncbi:hypothetical protein HPB50_022118 [Hyalomma asiaticum]|uniref:Uncharacterized protein n=1 Tax=Hyalomma asiaticum TaxID=266040 RepID=A0ACB7RNZ5_HYAAI|nr:hypothetical protein HPB50_022118 [Hyalomma asiaticum]